ncbi:MAG: hypothetical protein LUE16_08210 [Lachnospiraceae bacterium]|nr:hypothetical protein [Lachnospiraceae bacterium]
MITILLTILKIIGFFLLVILGLVLLILCLVLFAPVKYRAKGAKHPEEMDVSAFISYLRPLVRVRVSYPAEQIVSVKILWFDLLKPREEKKGGTRKEKAAGKKTDRDKKKPDEAPEQQKQDSGQTERDHKQPGQVQERPDRLNPEDKEIRPSAKSSEEEEPVARLETFSEESSDQQNDPEDKNGKESNTGRKEPVEMNPERDQSSQKREGRDHPKKTEKKTDKKASDSEEASGEKAENKIVAIAALLWQYKEMYPDVLGKVFKALKTILPRKCNIHLIFGTGAPESTGYLYAAYCALGEYLPGTIEFEPVWMESYLDVEFELGGKIRLIHFVTAAVKIIADKRVRHFISEIRRI